MKLKRKNSQGIWESVAPSQKEFDDFKNDSSQQLAEKINQGEVSVFDIDKNIGKLDQTYMTEEFLQQITGNTPINAVPAQNSVTLNQIAFHKKSTNLYNKLTVKEDVLINRTTGTETANTSFRASDFTPIKPSTNYYLRTVRHIAYYDANKQYVSGVDDTSGKANYLFTTPSNAVFIRFSWGKTDIPDTVQQQLNEGTQQLPYEDYYIIIDKKYVEKHSVLAEDIAEKAVTYKKTNFIKIGKNIFDKSKATPNKYVNWTNGTLMDNNDYHVSDFTEVEPNTTYARSISNHIAYFTQGKLFISGVQNSGTTFTTPANCYFIRFSVNNSQLNSHQIEKGSAQTSFESYGFVIPNLINQSNQNNTPVNVASDFFGKHLLKSFQAQAGKYNNPSFNERLEIALLGDSWIRSGHRIATPLRDKLKGVYGDGGIGFTGFAEIRLGNGETIVSTTGTWETINGAKGLDRREYKSIEVGATVTLVTHEPSTNLEIHYIQQAGSYRYRINGGAWSTVDTSQATSITANFATSNITLDIEVLSGTVTLLNAYLFNGSKGSIVHKLGFGGATAGNFVTVERAHFISEFQKTNIKAVGILLGTNDMAQNVPISTFKNNIIEIINRIKTAKPLTDVFLITPSGNNLTGKLHTMKEYADTLLEVAISQNVGYVSLLDNLGSYSEANARGLFEDDVHPNIDGGYVIANVVYDRLLRTN